MKRKGFLIFALFLSALLLTGCMRTADQMYQLPRRSEEFEDLQSAIDVAMTGLSYCAPLSGENQQAVQMADLDADGVVEYLVFAKSDSEVPLRILIFRDNDDTFTLVQTISSNGTAFDMVEYVQMDDSPGLEIVFGSQLTDKLLRCVAVYTFQEDFQAELLLSTNYTKFLTVDLNRNDADDLFVLKPGTPDDSNAIAELYSINKGKMERSNEMNLSGPVERLKRIIVGNIHGGIPAVYVATNVDDTALITDVYILNGNRLSNVTLSNESGTSVNTMRNYFIYADDIDNDGVVELPHLIPMMPMSDMVSGGNQELIRWYALKSSGEEIIKDHTFHNFIDGWFLKLNSSWASQVTVINHGSEYMFYIWDEEFSAAEMVLTIGSCSKQVRNLLQEEHFVLYENDSIVITAQLHKGAAQYGITQDEITESFHMIRHDWKTGET